MQYTNNARASSASLSLKTLRWKGQNFPSKMSQTGGCYSTHAASTCMRAQQLHVHYEFHVRDGVALPMALPRPCVVQWWWPWRIATSLRNVCTRPDYILVYSRPCCKESTTTTKINKIPSVRISATHTLTAVLLALSTVGTPYLRVYV